MVLVTQNPVDVDYKALSNAGTWFIGKLQTDQDKQRLLDGLQGAMSGDLNRGEYDRLISTLGKRVFLLHNVHASQPLLFETRWAMNYLAGPMTRTQIPQLNSLWKPLAAVSPPAGPLTGTPTAPPQPVTAPPPAPAVFGVPSQPPVKATMVGTQPAMPADQPVAPPQAAAPQPELVPVQPAASPVKASQAEAIPQSSATRPTIPAGVKEYFLPNNLTFTQAFKAAGKPYPQEAFSQGLLYRPVLLSTSRHPLF